MPDIAELGVKVTLAGAQAAADGLNNVATAGTKAEESARRLRDTTGGLSKAQQDLVKQARDMAAAAQQLAASDRAGILAMQQKIANIRSLATQTENLSLVQKELTSATQATTFALNLSSDRYNENRRLVLLHAEALALDSAANQGAVLSFNAAGAGLGRVRQGLTSLAARATGTMPVFDRLGGSLLAGFGAGSGVIIGVLAGIAAVSYAWKAMESDADRLAKKVSEAMKKVRDETLNGQLAMGDLQLSAAQENVKKAQRALDLANAGTYDGAAAKTGIATVNANDVANAKKALDQANADLIHWQSNKSQIDYQMRGEAERSNADYLAELVKSNHATAEERQRALDLYRKDVAEIAALGKSQTDNVRRVALIAQAETLRTALTQTPADKAANQVAEHVEDTVAKLKAETQSLLAENAARDQGVAALDAWRIANAGALAVADVANRQRDAENTARQKGLSLSTAQIAAFAREKDAVRAAAEAYESAKVSVEHHTKAVNEIDGLKARAAAIQQETAALAAGSDTRETYAVQKEYDIELTKALKEATLDDMVAHILAAQAVRDASLAHIEVADAIKAEEAAAKKAAAEQEHVLKTMLEGMQHSLASFFDNVLTKGVLTFRSLFDEIKNMFLKLLADMAAADIAKKMAPAMASMFGFPSGRAAGGVGGAGVSGETAGVSGLGTSMLATAGAGLGIAAGGFAAGQVAGSFTTNRALGALGGAASGAATGAAIGAMGGPIGVVAGAFIGAAAGAVGGFLGAGHAAAMAAEELRKMQLAESQVASTLADWRAQITGTAADQKAAAKADLYYKYLSIRQTIEQVEAGKKMEEQRNKDLAEADALYKQAQDALTKSTNALSASMLNAVQGYKYQAAIFAAAPFGNSPSPIPPPPSSGGSSSGGNSTGGGPLGGSDSGPLTVNLVMSDGTALGSAVIADWKKRKARGDTSLQVLLS